MDNMASQENDDVGFDTPDDFLWGFGEIGGYMRRTPAQASYMFANGLLGNAVKKLSHKVAVASKTRLRKVMAQPPVQ